MVGLLLWSVAERRRSMAVAAFTCFVFVLFLDSASCASHGHRRSVIEVEGQPNNVVWVAQLSDLHFSLFYPERAADFRMLLGPALSMINPSLVLITGDLTDGKSKDLSIMKQEEAEWIEYKNATEDIILRSGLDKKIFYDLRGNHDSFGVPQVGGEYDHYGKYSINSRLRRHGNIQSVTLRHRGRTHIFVGIDSAMEIGVRGPTNLFGHPTDELLADLDMELGQWDKKSTQPITKISFGHFPLSFTATTDTGKSLKDVFLKHSISAYLCGHLHTRFGKNLKRHHVKSTGTYFQFNMYQGNPTAKKNGNCSTNAEFPQEFWEWEMGDWRKSRILRIVAIDSGHASFLDIDYRLGFKDTIILPTFPLDSRFMQRISSPRDFQCGSTGTSLLHETVRALVFSRRSIISVLLKIYDSRSGHFDLVLDQEMMKVKGNGTRGDMYVSQWNWRAFVDPSPDRFMLQIEAIDISGKSTRSQPRPFSVNGLTAHTSWSWREFFVMGVQWSSFYPPLLHFVFMLLFSLLLVPRGFLIFSKNYASHNKVGSSVRRTKSVWMFIGEAVVFVLVELSRIRELWCGILLYLLYLVFFPWFFGQVFCETGKMAYMTHRGWSVTSWNNANHSAYSGVPDIMVIILPHLGFVVLPTVLVVGAMAAERTAFRDYFHSLTGKKEDDNLKESKRHLKGQSLSAVFRLWSGRWMSYYCSFAC